MYLSIYPSTYLSIYLPIYLSIYLRNLLSLQGIVYKEYRDGCERWEAEKIKLVEEKRELDARHEQDQIRIQELKVSEFLPLSPLFSCSLSLSPSAFPSPPFPPPLPSLLPFPPPPLVSSSAISSPPLSAPP